MGAGGLSVSKGRVLRPSRAAPSNRTGRPDGNIPYPMPASTVSRGVLSTKYDCTGTGEVGLLHPVLGN